MEQKKLLDLLEKVRDGKLAPREAASEFTRAPTQDLGFARIDHHRALRTGFPEVVFGSGKTTAEIVRIAGALISRGGPLLVTRVSPETAGEVAESLPELEYHPLAGALTCNRPSGDGEGLVIVVTAGTSDRPVAEEALVTAETMGSRVERLYDVGVAGIHRILAEEERLRRARVVVVIAGMEGALPSVVGGLVDAPVIAVPTSVGYGASLGGIAALLGMLNSCAAGVTVVNIDNGFGAGYAAHLINRGSRGGAA